MEVREPKTNSEFDAYYELRYKVLREPWGQPRGSEKDELEAKATHLIAKDGGEVVGCGRVHLNSPEEAQIRYMAVEESCRGRGVGEAMLKELEKAAKKKGANRVVLNARSTAVGFYEKNGYTAAGEGHTLFGTVKHLRMRKGL